MKCSSSAAKGGPARPRSPGHLLTWPQTRSYAIWTWTPRTSTCCCIPRIIRLKNFIPGMRLKSSVKSVPGCGVCASMCRYDAVGNNGNGFSIDQIRCEGCKVCVEFCPEKAIDFPQKHCGHWYLSSTRFGPMVHAQLFPGAANSGRLVMVLKQQARELVKSFGKDLILCDGAPGIGCPVISSLSGTNLAVAVTEPTPSGRHDLERVADLCSHFQVTFRGHHQ